MLSAPPSSKAQTMTAETMLVVDEKASEHARQRRRANDGRLLHCCCVCGALAKWEETWSTYCSMKELDDNAAIPKFCSEKCREVGGARAVNITVEMKQRAWDAEWREPEIKYRSATDREKYRAAIQSQKRTP